MNPLTVSPAVVRRREKILTLVPETEKGQGLSVLEIWNLYGLDGRATVRRTLDALMNDGLVCREWRVDRWTYRRKAGQARA